MRARRSAHDDFVLFLQWIIDICSLKIKNVRAWYYLTGRRGGAIPALLGWYEFTFRMDEGPESYANRRSQRGGDNPGGGGGGGI